MGLLTRRAKDDAGAKVESARFQVGLAVLKMERVLDQVQNTADKAKEELRERRAG